MHPMQKELPMATYQYIYVMKGLSKTFPGGRELFKDIWLSFLPGAKIGIIGVNGTGKSTLMKIIARMEPDFQGEAWAAEGSTVGYLPQEPALDPALTVRENIMTGLTHINQLLEAFEAVSHRFSEPLTDAEMDALISEQAELQEKIDAVDGWDVERRIQIAMDALRCPPSESAVTHLSGGEKRRVALCRLLLQHPDMLLLDEPTNHLDAESIAWLERFLKEYSGTVILVTHDRYFLDNVVTWILELDRGQGIPFEGNYSTWLEQKQKRLQLEGRQDASRQRVLAKELEWIRQSPKARQAKSKARVTAYEDLLAEEARQGLDQAQIVIPIAQRLGTTVLEADALGKHFGDKLLFEGVTFRLPPGGIVGVIGANGAGKTTLCRLLTGQEAPDSGKLKIGDTVEMGYVDQSRESLNDGKTVWEEISDGFDDILLGKQKVSSRAYCSSFNFKGSDQQKKVGFLSGGERNRVHLAKLLKSGANLLFLDEPTNDLDLETLRALEEALLSFAGCAVVISHDRWFLDRIATHMLAFEGDSSVVWFEGNYESYEADRKRRLGQEAQPRPLKYKKIS
jgi:energy-dependent translational throttle protein EttA